MMTAQEKLDEAIKQFPETFGMRGFPGKVFRVSHNKSYISCNPLPNTILIYTQVQAGNEWLDFAKGTPGEIEREIV